jgi:hypothetical protein
VTSSRTLGRRHDRAFASGMRARLTGVLAASPVAASKALGRLAFAPMSSVAPRRLTVCEQLLPGRQCGWSEVLSTAGSPTAVRSER